MSQVVSLLFGIGIIIAFSYERFNRISYGAGLRLGRLVTFLTPDKMRASRQVTYAYFIYTLTLVVLYLILCAYGDVLLPLIGAEGAKPLLGAGGLPNASPEVAPAGTSGQTDIGPLGKSVVELWTEELKPSEGAISPTEKKGIGIAPETSMGLALIMVGLAPSIPALLRVDEWLRMVAHRMAGIPTWVIDASDALRANANKLKIFSSRSGDDVQKTGDYLISASEFQTMQELREKAQQHLGNLNDFCLNIEVIIVASAWFIDERLHVSGSGDKLRFKEIEDELRKRKNALIESAGARKLTREDWERLAIDADALASDFCVLIALYDEQDVIQPYGSRPPATADQRRARVRLKSFVDVLYTNKTEPMMHRRGTNLTLFWTLTIVMIWTMLWAVLWPGSAEFNLSQSQPDSDAYLRIRVYSMTAFNTYCMAAIVAITLRWVRTITVAEDGLRKWENMRYPSGWTRWLPQALLVLFLASAISTTLFIAIQIWQSGFLQSDDRLSFSGFLNSVQRRFEYNAPIAVRAATLSLLVVILLDARQRLWLDAGRFQRTSDETEADRKRLEENTKKWKTLSVSDSLTWAAVGVGVMLVATVVTRYLTFLASVQFSGRDFDNIDAGLMIWAVLYNTILGALVMFCLSEVLTPRAFDRPRANKNESDAPTTAGATR